MKRGVETASGSSPYRSATEAWRGVLHELKQFGADVPGVTDPFSVGSNFGSSVRSTREIVGHRFTIDDPRNRLVRSRQRPVNDQFAIANALWALSGSDDLSPILYFNPKGKAFSDDGSTLYSAPGKRIFASAAGDQFAAAADRLLSDPTSRRSTIQFARIQEVFTVSRDISCTTGMQFLIRQGKLECITTMRSQSALMVMPYDLYLFTMLHEAMAVLLETELGRYHHFSGSLHVYEDEMLLMERVLTESEELMPVEPMPRMQTFSEPIRQSLTVAFRTVRNGLAHDQPFDLKVFDLDEYWIRLLSKLSAPA